MTTVVLLVAATVLVLTTGGVLLLRRGLLLVTVEGGSMEPAYHEGDRLIVRRTGLGGVRRGAVVVLTASPDAPATDPPLLVKRAVAVPGDPVPAGIPVPDRLVPAGRLIVLGDNTGRSADSRVRGFFPADEVVGVVIRRQT